MEAPVISPDVLARYAGDAALEVAGVSGPIRDAAEISSSSEDAHVASADVVERVGAPPAKQ